MKIKYFYTALSAAIILFLSIAAVGSGGTEENNKTNKDIIKFSHAVHFEATDCATCHVGVMESTTLNDRVFPNHDVCSTCHDVEEENSCTTCHYEDVMAPLIKKKSELIFDHKYHVGEQKQECITCHKGLDEVAYSFESKAVNPPMASCYTCHNDNTIATITNCESCHISTTNLVPQDHKQIGFFRSHKFNSMANNAQCEMCHDNNFCESCHVSTTMLTESNGATDFYTPYSPHNYVDNTKQQQLSRVHDLNYRFTHGIDLKGKTTDCQTCHQTETFCAECHDSQGGDFASEGMVPASHRAPDFLTIGVGTGGGQHAILAKRDIERCASCHDVQGADANCILCHVDNDGVKGTNPKTHMRTFMSSSDNGDWHSDMNSVCYQCHTDANARPNGIKGIGFCGYCHN